MRMPGGPASSTLWRPAAASSSARVLARARARRPDPDTPVVATALVARPAAARALREGTRPLRRDAGALPARRRRAPPLRPTRPRTGSSARPCSVPSGRRPTLPAPAAGARRARARPGQRDHRAARTGPGVGGQDRERDREVEAGAFLPASRGEVDRDAPEGHSSSALVTPLRTRSRASLQALSGNPTIVNAGTPAAGALRPRPAWPRARQRRG